MTNEEIAAEIKAGREDLYTELWQQVKGFVAQQARQRYLSTGGFGGVEVEDLIQSGFLALVAAVGYFEPAGEYSFLTVLGKCLKTAFACAGGYRTSKRDPLNLCRSLDEPLGDDPEGDTLLDMLSDSRDAFEEADRRIWLAELRGAMAEELSKLPREESRVLLSRYYDGLNYAQIGAESGISPTEARTREHRGLVKLRQPDTRLSGFVEEQTNYYTRVGVADFHRTQTSAVEVLVLKRERLAASYAATVPTCPRSIDREKHPAYN